MLKNMALSAAALGVLLGMASLGAQQPAATPAAGNAATEEANKKLALSFFRDGITAEERAKLLHPDYIQHNPLFKRFEDLNHLQGSAGFLPMMKIWMAPGGRPPRGPESDPKQLVMAQGDLVTIVRSRQLPDPQNPGKYYEAFGFDTFRVKDGKLYEHWDAATIPDPVPPYLQKPMASK